MGYDKLVIQYPGQEQLIGALQNAAPTGSVAKILSLPEGIGSVRIVGGQMQQPQQGRWYSNPQLETALRKADIMHEISMAGCHLHPWSLPSLTKSQLEKILNLPVVKEVEIIPNTLVSATT